MTAEIIRYVHLLVSPWSMHVGVLLPDNGVSIQK